MINAKGLSQVIVYVKDMAAQVAFYRDVLGLPIAFPHVDDYGGESWVAFRSGQCTFALHGGGTGAGSPDAPRFNFEVNDIEAARAHLADVGAWTGDVRSPIPNVFIVDGRDPEGNYFTLRQSP